MLPLYTFSQSSNGQNGEEDAGFTWTGDVNRNWFHPGNWKQPDGEYGPCVPGAGSDNHILIPKPDEAPNQPVLYRIKSTDGPPPPPENFGCEELSLDVIIAGTLTLEEGATLTIQPGDATLTLPEGAHVISKGEGDPETRGRIVLISGARYADRGNVRPLLEMRRRLGPADDGSSGDAAPGWRMIASPLHTNYADLTDSIITQGFPGADHPENNPGNPETFTPNLLWWDETDDGTTLQSWRVPRSTDNGHDLSELSVPAGRGHFYFNFDGAALPENAPDTPADYQDALPRTLVVTGKEYQMDTNNGERQFEFGKSDNFPVTRTPRDTGDQDEGDGEGEDGLFIDRVLADEGWNLLGNPTASALLWDLDEENNGGAWSSQHIDETIYVWDPSANNGAGDYLTWNGQAGDESIRRIAPWQAFWVKANNNGNGDAQPSLSFTNDAKTLENYTFTGGQNPPFAFSGSSGALPSAGKLPASHPAPPPSGSTRKTSDVISVTLTGAGMSTRNWLMFSEAGRLSYDRFDAFRLEPLEDSWISAATSMEPGGPSLVINSLPREITRMIRLPYYVGAAVDGQLYEGEFELEWSVPDALRDGRRITLMDHEDQVAVNMLVRDSYRFGHETEEEMAPEPALDTRFAKQTTSSSGSAKDNQTGARVAYGLPRLPDRIAFQGSSGRGDVSDARNAFLGSGTSTRTGQRDKTDAAQTMPATTQDEPDRAPEPRFSIVLSPEDEIPYIPFEPELQANYPNPFNPETTIPYTLPTEQQVRIEIYDILGRRIATIVNTNMPGGVHEARWNATGYASGIYIVRMITEGGDVLTRKMTLLK